MFIRPMLEALSLFLGTHGNRCMVSGGTQLKPLTETAYTRSPSDILPVFGIPLRHNRNNISDTGSQGFSSLIGLPCDMRLETNHI